MPEEDDLQQPQSRLFAAKRKTINLMFRRMGVPVKVWREVDLGGEDEYGKEEEAKILVTEDQLAVIDATGTRPGGSGIDRVEERFGEHVYWEPIIYFPSNAVVEEKDVIEYPMPRYPENPNPRKQLWELETIAPFETHIEGNLQRFIEQ